MATCSCMPCLHAHFSLKALEQPSTAKLHEFHVWEYLCAYHNNGIALSHIQAKERGIVQITYTSLQLDIFVTFLEIMMVVYKALSCIQAKENVCLSLQIY